MPTNQSSGTTLGRTLAVTLVATALVLEHVAGALHQDGYAAHHTPEPSYPVVYVVTFGLTVQASAGGLVMIDSA